jgi:tetratricopeptide (TPR) repeat protein
MSRIPLYVAMIGAAITISFAPIPLEDPGSTAWAAAPDEAALKADAEFRAAWVALVTPATGATHTNPLEARQQACAAAIPHMEAAAAAQPRNPLYQASLAYLCLAAGKYHKAQEAINLAIDVKRDEPLYYLLRGQAEAALTQMDPPTAAQRIGPALAAFDRAATLDQGNALPLLQAASVAFDVDRSDLALPRLKKALERDDFSFYFLPVPFDLFPVRSLSVKAWQHVQVGYWMEALARCRYVAAVCLGLGLAEEEAGEFDAARGYYQNMLRVGRIVGESTPNVFVAVAAAIDLMEDAYMSFARLAEKGDGQEVERWRGEAGVLAIGRTMLAGALEAYVKQVGDRPPATVEALLGLEARYLADIMAGVDLSPAPPKPGGNSTEPNV